MSIILAFFSVLSLSVFAHPVPKHTKTHAQARHRSTAAVLKSKNIHYTENEDHQRGRVQRGIASEKRVKKIPWKIPAE